MGGAVKGTPGCCGAAPPAPILRGPSGEGAPATAAHTPRRRGLQAALGLQAAPEALLLLGQRVRVPARDVDLCGDGVRGHPVEDHPPTIPALRTHLAACCRRRAAGLWPTAPRAAGPPPPGTG